MQKKYFEILFIITKTKNELSQGRKQNGGLNHVPLGNNFVKEKEIRLPTKTSS
jgi:hypothetical protein